MLVPTIRYEVAEPETTLATGGFSSFNMRPVTQSTGSGAELGDDSYTPSGWRDRLQSNKLPTTRIFSSVLLGLAN